MARWRERAFDAVVFQTGVGTRALFAATDRAELTRQLVERLQAACVIVRGPKPVGEFCAARRSRLSAQHRQELGQGADECAPRAVYKYLIDVRQFRSRNG